MKNFSFNFFAQPHLAEERIKQGISTKEMCEKVSGLDEQSLELIETQRRHVGPAWRLRIAEILQLPENYLFCEFSEEEIELLRKNTLDGHYFRMQPIEIDIYRPHPEKKGCLLQVGRKTVQQVYVELAQRLKERGMMPEEYFNISVGAENILELPFPEHRWIACFAVRGDSEGHFIHVEVIAPDGSRKLLYLGKTFQGLARAQAIANACGAHLEW